MRGEYDFNNNGERIFWIAVVNKDVGLLLSGQSDPISYARRDISPAQMYSVLGDLGFEWESDELNRDGKYTYFYDDENVNIRACVYINFDTFDMTLDVYEKEED